MTSFNVQPTTCPKCKGTDCTLSKSGQSIHCGECRERFTLDGKSCKDGKNYSQGKEQAVSAAP